MSTSGVQGPYIDVRGQPMLTTSSKDCYGVIDPNYFLDPASGVQYISYKVPAARATQLTCLNAACAVWLTCIMQGCMLHVLSPHLCVVRASCVQLAHPLRGEGRGGSQPCVACWGTFSITAVGPLPALPRPRDTCDSADMELRLLVSACVFMCVCACGCVCAWAAHSPPPSLPVQFDGNSCGQPTKIFAAPLDSNGTTMNGTPVLLITNDDSSWEGG